MAQVDVTTKIVIARPRSEVGAYCCDPDNATAWYVNIKTVQWQTPKPATVGSQFAFTARFHGRTLRYTYQVTDLQPESRFVMRTAQGPFPMETSYLWEDGPGDSTLMTLRNRGKPTGFGGIAAPVLEMAIRRANLKDLARLKSLLEARSN